MSSERVRVLVRVQIVVARRYQRAVFLLLVALGAYLLLKSNYHLIFIPKEVSANDEWGTPDK